MEESLDGRDELAGLHAELHDIDKQIESLVTRRSAVQNLIDQMQPQSTELPLRELAGADASLLRGKFSDDEFSWDKEVVQTLEFGYCNTLMVPI